MCIDKDKMLAIVKTPLAQVPHAGAWLFACNMSMVILLLAEPVHDARQPSLKNYCTITQSLVKAFPVTGVLQSLNSKLAEGSAQPLTHTAWQSQFHSLGRAVHLLTWIASQIPKYESPADRLRMGLVHRLTHTAC